MKNGDMPAMAISTSESICQLTGTLKAEFAGLTKREMFAMAAMQGLLSSLAPDESVTDELLAKSSVAVADALLAELERTK